MDQLPEVLRRLLQVRGIGDADLEGFLNPSLRDLAKPSELPGVEAAASVILDALVARRHIVVFGDYDCDGVCATAILVKVLREISGDDSLVSSFLPNRLTEGYGMSDASIARMLGEDATKDAGLVVTVDNGINSVEQVAELKKRGIDVVVTDHHLAGHELLPDGTSGEMVLPDAAVVVDPKVAAPKRLEELCGAGVAFFLAWQLVEEARARGLYDGPAKGPSLCVPLLVLAGLATVTDIMPLLGQNRILVAEALKRFDYAPLGLKELYLHEVRNSRGAITAKDFGCLIGPRMNAAGRMDSATDALDLVIKKDIADVRRCVIKIVECNALRKEREREMTQAAMEQALQSPKSAAYVIDLPDGHPGVAGIVAARVMERLGGNVPVCVIAGGHGSGRAPDGLNIRDAFVACDEVLSAYGGHAAAGGFSVKKDADGKEMVDQFRKMLNDYCAKLTPAAVSAKGSDPVELWLEKPADVTLQLAEDLLRLEPYGEGNPEPVFGLRGVEILGAKPLGQDGRHLVCQVKAPGAPVQDSLRAIWWNRSDLAEKLQAQGSDPHDIAFTVTISDYGDRHPELRFVSIS